MRRVNRYHLVAPQFRASIDGCKRVEVLNDGHGRAAASRCRARIASDDPQPLPETVAHLNERRPLGEVHAVVGLVVFVVGDDCLRREAVLLCEGGLISFEFPELSCWYG